MEGENDMKKGTAVGLALLLSIPGMSSVALADELTDPSVEDVVDEHENEEDQDIELEVIKKLTLEQAIERALEDNSSLMLLKYQLEIIDNQEGNTNKDFRETAFDIRDLERTRDRLRKLGSSTFQERLMIQQQLEALEDKMKMLEDALEQVKSGKVTLAYTDEEAKASIKMGTAATYMQLLIAEEQRNFKKKALQTKDKEVNMMKRQYELGTLSYNEYSRELREIERQKADIAKDEKQWNKDVAAFALDLGILYDEDLKLAPVKLANQQLVSQEKETEELITNLFKYKSQEEAISLAEYTRERVHDDEDSTVYEKNEADLKVKVEKENLAKLKMDAETSIRQLYYEVEDSYQAIQDAEREWRYAQEDMRTLQRRYELGLISQAQYELAQIQLDQAKLSYDLARQAYFLKTQQVELLEAGVI